MEKKDRVLFLCTGNTARSQMAEAFLTHYAGDRFEVYSAGLEPGVINPLTVEVMKEIGYDLSGQRAKGIEGFLGKVFIHTLITVCDRAEKNCPSVWPGITEKLHWSFEDPATFEGTETEKLAKFRQTRELIDQRIRAWLKDKGIEVA
jgi:arsenate reductase